MSLFKYFMVVVYVFVLAGCGLQGAYQTLDMKSKELVGVQATNLSVSESWGRWTDGSPVTFKFSSGLPKDFRLVLLINSTAAPSVGKPVEVKVAEQKQSFVGRATAFSVQLDFKDVPRGTDTVSISIPETYSPKDHGQSADPRKLGLALVSLEIAPLKSN